MSGEERDNPPECADCDGNCCQSFILFRDHDKRPWSRRRVEKDIAKDFPMFNAGEVVIDGGYVQARCSCRLFVDGRCSDYANRPAACREFPCSERVRASNEDDRAKCPLLKRLWDELQAARDEKTKSTEEADRC